MAGSIMAAACSHGRHISSSGGGKPTKIHPAIYSVHSKLIFDNETKVFRPGDVVSGIFEVTSVPPNDAPEINGLLLKLEGVMQDNLKLKKEAKAIIRVKQYFFGDGKTELGPLKKGEYKFGLVIPADSPATFVTWKLGWIKYTLKVVAHMTYDGYYSFDSEAQNVVIISRTVSHWKNHEYLTQPMFALKEVPYYSVVPGKIQLSLNTDQKCYEPGAMIQFVLKVKNEGGENVTAMAMQLQQTVNYNFKTLDNVKQSTQSEHFMLPAIAVGPSVSSDSTQTWNGSLIIPAELQPSIQEYSHLTPITFQYNLLVTLQMTGCRNPDINEEFDIHIGNPVDPSLSPKMDKLIASPDVRDSNFLGDGIVRRMSMISVTPSLPDYNSATAPPPPSVGMESGLPRYSSLDLSF